MHELETRCTRGGTKPIRTWQDYGLFSVTQYETFVNARMSRRATGQRKGRSRTALSETCKVDSVNPTVPARAAGAGRPRDDAMGGEGIATGGGADCSGPDLTAPSVCEDTANPINWNRPSARIGLLSSNQVVIESPIALSTHDSQTRS